MKGPSETCLLKIPRSAFSFWKALCVSCNWISLGNVCNPFWLFPISHFPLCNKHSEPGNVPVIHSSAVYKHWWMKQAYFSSQTIHSRVSISLPPSNIRFGFFWLIVSANSCYASVKSWIMALYRAWCGIAVLYNHLQPCSWKCLVCSCNAFKSPGVFCLGAAVGCRDQETLTAWTVLNSAIQESGTAPWNSSNVYAPTSHSVTGSPASSHSPWLQASGGKIWH